MEPQHPTAYPLPDDKVLYDILQPNRFQTQVAPKSDTESWLDYYKRVSENPLFTFTEKCWWDANRFSPEETTLSYDTAIEGPLLIYYFAYNERTGNCSSTQWVEV